MRESPKPGRFAAAGAAGAAGVEPERSSVSVAQARELILGAIEPLGFEQVGLVEAVGRVLGEEISSAVEIPPADNSAMDGYALRAQDTAQPGARLRIVEELPAGRRATRKLGPGEAARIMTGAAIPEGADAVVMVEQTERADATVKVNATVAPGDNVRRAGCDVRPGTLIASQGELLRAAHVGMLAAIGRTRVRVAARPRVAILATGDELVEPDRLRGDGRIVSSNSYTLQAALREIGLDSLYLGIAPDEPEEIAASFREALRCDVVLSTGGVSVGDRDWIKQVLAGMGGRMHLWRVNMKPGAPLAFVMLDSRPVFGLPGNPVSTLVAFEQFVRPALLSMMRHKDVFRPVESAVLTQAWRKPAGRMHFVRVALERRSGVWHATPTGEQASNILLSMVRADALAIIPAETTELRAGEQVAVQLLRSDARCAEPGY